MDNPILSTLYDQLRDRGVIHTTWGIFTANPPPYYYTGKGYFYPASNQRFYEMNEASLEAALATFGLGRKKPDSAPSECEMARTFLQQHHAVEYAGQLAGYSIGLHQLRDGSRILVTGETRPVEPKPGDWPILR